jgi:exosortase D (VPLPA-CTERM-specific)
MRVAAPMTSERAGPIGRERLAWLVVGLIVVLSAAYLFGHGLAYVGRQWNDPEYSHGWLIPLVTLFVLWMRCQALLAARGPGAWSGVAITALALLLLLLSEMAFVQRGPFLAFILLLFGLALAALGRRATWLAAVPLAFLLFAFPLPGSLAVPLSTTLQLISSRLGAGILDLLGISVFLDGNIIDLGVYKLQVAEACSGLRYLFPILSFSYIFAVLYRGSTWHKAVLLLAAVPITVLMNSVRIAIAGIGVNHYGLDFVEGFSHFFEGWVIFLACVLILFGLARLLLLLNPSKMSLAEALDLDTSGLGTQAARIRLVQPSAALVLSAMLLGAGALAWQAMPERGAAAIAREDFRAFPRELGDWRQEGPAGVLSEDVARTLAADDYHDVTFVRGADEPSVSLFMAWYRDQSQGGVHSPEICLPGGGWEIAWLQRTDVAGSLGSVTPYNINRAIIQRGETRMMVYYWFEQKGRHIAWDFAAKYWLMVDGIRTGRTDGALVRLTTPILRGEGDEAAEARLKSMLVELQAPLPRFIPEQ